MSEAANLTNQKFGKLTALQRDYSGKKSIHAKWLCQCECGNQIVVLATNLKRSLTGYGGTKSCGCYNKERWNNEITKHGLYYTDEHTIYQNMISRCYNKNDKYYYTYGAIGITVCDEWLGENGLINFIKDMNMKPFKDASIERIDNNKGYYKNNCKWIDKKEQSRNRNYNKIKDLNHANQIRLQYSQNNILMSELARINNCSVTCISKVINNLTWV